MREVLHLIAQLIVSPSLAMGEVRQKAPLWILFIYPLMAILVIFSSGSPFAEELSVFSLAIGTAFLSTLFAAFTAFLAAILYILSRYYRRATGYISYLSGLAFCDIPIVIELLLRGIFPYFNRRAESGSDYFILSAATLLPTDLDVKMPVIFNLTAYVLEPFRIWSFGLLVLLVSSFLSLTRGRSLLIAFLLLMLFPLILTIVR